MRLPDALGGWITAKISSLQVFLLLIKAVLLFIGTFMEVNAEKVMLRPVLFPIAMSFGIEPIHFGVIVTVNLCLGLLTAPVGIALALTSKIDGVSAGSAACARAWLPSRCCRSGCPTWCSANNPG